MPLTTSTTVSDALLLASCDRSFNSTGVWGVATLLTNLRQQNQSSTTDPINNTVLCSVPHLLVSGARIRIITGAVLPILTTVDYRVLVLTPTTFRLLLLDNTSVVALPAISLTLVWSEQLLLATDPADVLLSKEVIHPGYLERFLIADLGSAVINPTGISKPPKLVQFTNATTVALNYQYCLFIESGSTQIGSNLNVSNCILLSFATAQTLTPANSPLGILVSFSTFT